MKAYYNNTQVFEVDTLRTTQGNSNKKNNREKLKKLFAYLMIYLTMKFSLYSNVFILGH